MVIVTSDKVTSLILFISRVISEENWKNKTTTNEEKWQNYSVGYFIRWTNRKIQLHLESSDLHLVCSKVL